MGNQNQSRHVSIRARGPLACFTRPELSVERFSYEVMTPSCARGILDSFFWKPSIRWQVHSIAVLSPIRWISYRRNEITDTGDGLRRIDVEACRTQRCTTALRDVDYIITASFYLTRAAGPNETVAKFLSQVERYLSRGAHYRPPYFGSREYPAHLSDAPAEYETIERGVDRPLGPMTYDWPYAADSRNRGPALGGAMMFNARLTDGVLHVPTWEQVARANGINLGDRR